MPSLKDRDLNSPSDPPASRGNVADKSANRQQPVALEVPVTVNGARPLEGSDKREPFSESSKTVLVFANGAVIRLASAVAPGQLLFLVNERTKKEVICQVVKSKNYNNVSGYVEVEFTEPVTGFWGLRFPAEQRDSKPGAPSATQYSGGGAESIAPIAAPTKLGSPDAFKTELKSDERASNRADLLASSGPSSDALKLEANRLQEQLSAMMFSEQPGEKSASSSQPASHKALSDTTAKLFEIAEAKSLDPATGALKSGEAEASKNLANKTSEPPLQTEELKVPAWLEPLARNAASPAPPQESVPNDDAPALEETPKSQPQEKPSKPSPRKTKSAQAVPVFAHSLLSEDTTGRAGSLGANKGKLFAVAAVFLIVGGGTAWYLLQPSLPSLSGGSTPASSATSTHSRTVSTASAASTAAQPSTTPLQQQSQSQNASAFVLQAPSVTTSANPSSGGSPAISATPAVISERVPNAAVGTSPSISPETSAEPAVPEPVRPSLGKVHLAKPKVNRSAKTSAIAEPTLQPTDGETLPVDATLPAGLAGESASQPAVPAAPAPVGGDVVPARLISSVPPIYPSMAKNQHISGDVRLDAVIDATGRVTSMKVISGPTLLYQAAMDALRQWKYRPASLDGKPVSMHLTVTLQFRLQ